MHTTAARKRYYAEQDITQIGRVCFKFQWQGHITTPIQHLESIPKFEWASINNREFHGALAYNPSENLF